MKMFIDTPKIYLHKQAVDFRKSINGLSLLVEQMLYSCWNEDQATGHELTLTAEEKRQRDAMHSKSRDKLVSDRLKA